MSRALTQEEITRRLIRLNNLEYLYKRQGVTLLRLKNENRELRRELVRLTSFSNEQQKTITDLSLLVEELRTIVFGKKKKPQDSDEVTLPQARITRTNDSYKRPIPKDSEVTETVYHPENACECGEVLVNQRTVTFYEEDIPVPTTKVVRKHIAHKGYCTTCRKYVASTPLPTSKVTLGLNVRKYTCYLSTVCRLSFSQIQELLQDTYSIHISQGEIVTILRKEAVHLLPVYEELKAKIRSEPIIHLDETSWKVLTRSEKSFAWVMSGSVSKENVFLVGESRGGGNVVKLTGENYSGTVVTDDYAVYDKITNHQLCFAHPLRKWRDLATSCELNDEQRLHCKEEYQRLATAYRAIVDTQNIDSYTNHSLALTDVATVRPLDPKKLIRYKTTLMQKIPQYLTCLTDPRIPLTNNQAERSLRHIVLKRKTSFGSLTKKTADTLAVLLSVLMSLKQRHQKGFFGEYLGV
jgi:transposase